MDKVTPFISFNDNQAEEAVRFYISLLPDSRIDRLVHSPIDTPGGPAGALLVIEFTLAGRPYYALNGSGFTFTNAFSFLINCTDQAEVDRLWSALTADGGEEVACGWCKDRWGMYWQITPTRMLELLKDPDPARAKRAMDAMVQMIKLNIAEIERAAEGV